MTKSECYSQISTCNAGIEEDQKKIREWEEKIDLYENTNRRLERGQENMADFVLVIAGKSVRQEIISAGKVCRRLCSGHDGISSGCRV